MLDQSLLQSHFIGRDGFRWWIGQVPPIKDKNGDVWSEQINQDGWGLRVKVRILGYHPLDFKELSNQELPWAQVMLPTTAGSGNAYFGTRPKVRQGDMVIGFFLDGDNAQIPVIMGVLGKTDEWGELGYNNPFTPFSGFTDNIPKPDAAMGRGTPTNEDKPLAQGAPAAVSPQNEPNRQTTSSSAVGTKVPFANTCENTTQTVIKTEIDNLLKNIQEAQGKISEYRVAIQNAAEVIKGALGWVINELFYKLELFLVGTAEEPGIISRGIQALYTSVYGATFAATQNPAKAHQLGLEAEKSLITPVQLLEKAIVCAKNAVLDGLTNFIVEILNSLLLNIKSFVSCAAEQFIGVILNTVVDQVSNALTTTLDQVLGILGIAFNIASFLRGGLDSLSGLFDCNQSNTKCDGTKEWIVGVGPKSSGVTAIENIFVAANTLGNIINAAEDQFNGTADAITSTIDLFNGNSSLTPGSIDVCYTGTPTSCGPPTLKIFGGGGISGEAVPIFGGILQSTTIVQNVDRTASIIGAVITNKGSGYRFPPFVEIADNCGLGYGAKARAVINDNGELESVYIVSPGTGYPVGNQEPSGVVDTVVQSSGIDYSTGDTASDDFGNEYELTIEDGRVISARPINSTEVSGLPRITVNSETGFGAVISPVFGSIFPPSTSQSQVDCLI